MHKTIIRILIWGILMLITAGHPANAQITVTASDAPSSPDIYFEMKYAKDVAVSPGLAGANQYWDFSNLNVSGITMWRPVPPETTPFIHRFPSSNLVYKVTETGNDTITYNYAQKTETALTELGQGKKVGDETTLLLVAKRATPKLNLPATYGDMQWASVLEVDSSLGVLDVTIIDSSYNTIDAWGTIKTAFGEFSCLRIRQDHSQIAYTMLGAIPIEVNINYFWVTNEKGILMTMTGKHNELNPNYSVAKSVNIMSTYLTAVDEQPQPTLPAEFSLLQNYPNPFNPSTTIRYRLDQPADVRLKIFNIAGQEVGLLVQEQQVPGDYSLEWNAAHLPSGVYYYHIQAGDKNLSRACVLLK
ncbi:MAG: T9SS type A sorting domain-containing protein [Candidatus Zhuqueibacterota bacterium]